MHQHDRRPPTGNTVPDPVPLELQYSVSRALSTSWVVRESATELAPNRQTSSRITIRIALICAMIIQTLHPDTEHIFSATQEGEAVFGSSRPSRPPSGPPWSSSPCSGNSAALGDGAEPRGLM